MEITEEIAEKVADIDRILDDFLPTVEGKQATIMKAMNYSVNVGGKRIRPLLMRETCRLFGPEDERVMPYFLSAIEMIHTYSLVHDDLPAMDDDEYRRGEKTTHVVFGEGMGVLAGDALLNYAFELMVTAIENDAQNTRAVKAMGILSRKAGIYGMIGGQVIDIETEGQQNDLETILEIHRLKTGALIEAAMMVGAALGGASDVQLQQVECAAGELGMAFQIQDDILDVIGDEAEIGKPVGSDEKNKKCTYVTLVGIDAAKEAVSEHSRRAISILMDLPGDNPFLLALMEYLIHRKR